MADPLILKVITTQHSYEQEADMVLLPSFDGQIGVLPYHIPLLTELEIGIVTSVFQNQKHQYFIYKGIAEITGEYVNILTDFSIDLSEITKNDIISKISKLEFFISSNPNSKDVLITSINLNYYKTLLNYDII